MTFNVLFIDSYDSFTYNVVNLIKEQGKDIHVTTIHNDTFSSLSALQPYLSLFDCIVLGPGPGNPVNGPKDIGCIQYLFEENVEIPILGICLGHQAMCHVQGGKIEQLKTIKHGQVYEVKLLDQSTLFQGYPEQFNSVRYHSLHVLFDHVEQSGIIPLAFTEDENGKILMAAQIKGRPWYGVQYHPESCCSELGDRLIRNFIQLAHKFNIESGRRVNILEPLRSDVDKRNCMLGILNGKIDKSTIYDKPVLHDKPIFLKKFNVTKSPKLTLKICDMLTQHFFLLASSTVNPNRGEWSIIALPNTRSTVFTHYDQLHRTSLHNWRDSSVTQEKYNYALKTGESTDGLQVFDQDKADFWKILGTFMKDKLIANAPDLPFVGGIIGILGYEMGQFTTNRIPVDEKLQPDAKLVYIEDSIVIDHKSGELYLISLSNEFPKEAESVIDSVMTMDDAALDVTWEKSLPSDVSYDIELPTKESYATAFNESQEYLHKGDSYEVCLTTQTRISPTKRISPWRIFQTLIQKNPAPFSSFFEFSDLQGGTSDMCLISTSPERFLKWNNDVCELRPIKGTVKKTQGMTFEKATSILKTPKEFGENLMILDLIRNDLYELLDKVSVEELMSVEEYETVYQLVSVVKARGMANSQYSGLDVLKHTLPPGSMTGAPKKITVELLQDQIENAMNKHIHSCGARGVYSGVTGYMSCNGNGDWSVNIRCMYSYDNCDTWYIGAGGAVTVLSTLEGEWEEMHIKLESALQVFK